MYVAAVYRLRHSFVSSPASKTRPDIRHLLGQLACERSITIVPNLLQSCSLLLTYDADFVPRRDESGFLRQTGSTACTVEDVYLFTWTCKRCSGIMAV